MSRQRRRRGSPTAHPNLACVVPRPILQCVKGIRYFLRNFTALTVQEHLRSQIERSGTGGELTANEIELARFAADRSDELAKLADRPPAH